MFLSKEILTLTIDDKLSIYESNERARAYGDPNAMMVFDPDAIAGWDDTPDIKRDATARPLSHGDFPSTGYYGPKLVTVTGHAIASTPADLYRLRDRVVSYLQDGEDHWVKVSKGQEFRLMRMSQGSTLSWAQQLDNYAKWKLDLYAADPRMYGGLKTAQAVSQSREGFAIKFPLVYPLGYGKAEAPTTSALVNEGNSPSWPTYTVNHTLSSGFVIQNGGKSIVFTGATFQGNPVTIDTFKGTATVGGRDRSYQLTKRDWSPIPPYGTLPVKFLPLDATHDGPWVDVTWRDTWV